MLLAIRSINSNYTIALAIFAHYLLLLYFCWALKDGFNRENTCSATADDDWTRTTNFIAFTELIILLLCSFSCHVLFEHLMLSTIASLYEIVKRLLALVDYWNIIMPKFPNKVAQISWLLRRYLNFPKIAKQFVSGPKPRPLFKKDFNSRRLLLHVNLGLYW